MRAIYVRLTPSELELLAAMAADERRDLHAQAAHLVSIALERWLARREFEASLSLFADSEPIEAGAA